MNVYLVISSFEQNVWLYRIMAATPKEAIKAVEVAEPFKKFYLGDAYGSGAIAIPYSTVNVLLTYVKVLFAKAEATPPKSDDKQYKFNGFVGYRFQHSPRHCNVVQ